MSTNSNKYASATFMNIQMPRPKLKRSFNTAMSMSFAFNKFNEPSNPTPPPFVIKTKTIDECAKLIVSKQLSHENQSNKKVYRINL